MKIMIRLSIVGELPCQCIILKTIHVPLKKKKKKKQFKQIIILEGRKMNSTRDSINYRKWHVSSKLQGQILCIIFYLFLGFFRTTHGHFLLEFWL